MLPEVKAQPIRLLDVFVIGPLMIWGGYALHGSGRRIAGPALLLLGFSTNVYNANNYEQVRRRHGEWWAA